MDSEFIRELFAQFRPLTVKRMFGGAGIYAEGVMFGLVFDDAIYLKVDAETIPDFEREGSQPFVYTRAKSPGRIGRASLSYWRLPERLYDDPDELAVWAGRALAIAERKKFAPRAGPSESGHHGARGPQQATTKGFAMCSISTAKVCIMPEGSQTAAKER